MFYSSKNRGFLSTRENLLHPIDGTERGSRTTPRELVYVLKDKS